MANIRPYPPVSVVGIVVSGIKAHIADPQHPKFDSETGANILRHWRLFCEYLLEREGMVLSSSEETVELSWNKRSRKRKSAEQHFSSLVVDPDGQAFSEYLQKRFAEVKPSTVRTETSSLRACVRILQAAGETSFQADDLRNPSVEPDLQKVLPFTEEMISQVCGLQSLQLAAQRDLALYVSFIRGHVSPQPTWKQEVAASKRLRRVKRISTLRKLAKEPVVVTTVSGQLIFCAEEWLSAFFEHLQPGHRTRQVVKEVQRFYRWLEKERLSEFDSTKIRLPSRLDVSRPLHRQTHTRSGYPIKQLTADVLDE